MRAFTRIALCSLPLVAVAQTPPPADMQRLSGSVERWEGQTLVLKTTAGDVRVMVPADARINSRRSGSLADIKPGSFVGSGAVTETNGHLRANEVHIFPDAMRGTGEGHRDMAAPQTTMTNGSVASMTNGSVAAAGSQGATTTLTIAYPGGQQLIDVSPDVPISVITPLERSAVTPGTNLTVMGRKGADGAVTAQMLDVGSRP